MPILGNYNGKYFINFPWGFNIAIHLNTCVVMWKSTNLISLLNCDFEIENHILGKILNSFSLLLQFLKKLKKLKIIDIYREKCIYFGVFKVVFVSESDIKLETNF